MMTLEAVKEHFGRFDPLSGHFGIEIVGLEKGRSVVEMPLEARHRNGMGTAHGVALYTLVDVAFAALSNANGLYCTNAQTSISYLAPGRRGPLRAEARVLRAGRLLSTYEVRVTDADGTLVAEAVVTGYGVGTPLPLPEEGLPQLHS